MNEGMSEAATGTVEPLSGRGRSGTSSSITKSIDEFVKGVQKMKKVVMVPHQLKDHKYLPEDGSTSGSPILDTPNSSDSSSVALISLPQDVPMVTDPDLLTCYKMVDAVYNDLVSGPAYDSPMSSPVPNSMFTSNATSPYPFSPSESTSPSPSVSVGDIPIASRSETLSFCGEEDCDETRLTLLVRQQVSNFLSALHQLTDIANHLTQKYQDQVGVSSRSATNSNP